MDALTARQTEATQRLADTETRLEQAPHEDARILADWIANREKGERPAPLLHERQRDRDAARIALDAVMVELDRALAERANHIERHRTRMLRDARRLAEFSTNPNQLVEARDLRPNPGGQDRRGRGPDGLNAAEEVVLCANRHEDL